MKLPLLLTGLLKPHVATACILFKKEQQVIVVPQSDLPDKVFFASPLNKRKLWENTLLRKGLHSIAYSNLAFIQENINTKAPENRRAANAESSLAKVVGGNKLCINANAVADAVISNKTQPVYASTIEIRHGVRKGRPDGVRLKRNYNSFCKAIPKLGNTALEKNLN